MAPRLKVLICGAGIAGLATALLLREDHDVTILESSSEHSEVGAAITLSMNASRLLRSSLARAGFDPVKARFVEADKFQELHWQDASVLLEWDMQKVCQKYSEPWWYFSRQDIHEELKRAALAVEGLGTVPTLELGAHAEKVDLDQKIVYLKDGRSFHGDVIVGADGIRTATGKSVFGDKIQTVFEGLSAYRCMMPSERLRNNPETALLVDSAKVVMFVGADRRIIAYPCSSWDTINFVCIFPTEKEEQRSQWVEKASVESMVAHFKDFHPCIPAALSIAEQTGVWQLRDRKPLDTLVEGCFALIGDAAHAMGPHQGQGACQAIEDGEVLRVVLKGATPDKTAERLAIFDKLRAERVKNVIEYTMDMAPKTSTAEMAQKKNGHRSTQTYSDYYWSYKTTQEAVEGMQAAGHNLSVVDERTGEIAVT